MDSKLKMIAAVAVVIVIAAASVFVITKDDGEDRTSISINGSTTVNPIMMSVEEKYEGIHSNISISITATGSGTGAAAAINGTADIAMLSRDLSASEISSGLVSTTIGKDGIAVIINTTGTTVDGLTLEQIAKIYDGTYTNWNQLGGDDKSIVVCGRESSSGTRGAFEEILSKKVTGFTSASVVDTMLESSSNNALLSAIEQTSYSIGYVSLGIADENADSRFKAVSVGGVAATVDNVVNGTYLLQRDLILATMGIASGAVADLIDYVLSDAGQKIVEDNGYIPLN